MSEHRSSRIFPSPWRRAETSRERPASEVAPFAELHFRRRGRIVSHIVAVQQAAPRDVFAGVFELFFALG